MKSIVLVLELVSISLVIGVSSCTDDSADVLAPYDAQRALFFTRITQNSEPDLAWLGGRVMAAGMNRGTRAALDSTLVWLQTASDNTVNSYLTFGKNADSVRMKAYGARLLDSLLADSVYTLWLAQKVAFDARLDPANSAINATTFVDTTFAASYWLPGKPNGQGGPTNLLARISILRKETMVSDTFIATWTPNNVPFRTLVINKGTAGSYKDQVWQIATPTGVQDNILPPVVIGVVPTGTTEVTPWSGGSFPASESGYYTLWMANKYWTGQFRPTATGYVWFQFPGLP